MQTTFLNMAGTVLFTRDDMEQGNWSQEEYTVNCTFPYDAGKVIERGMRLAFRDPATNNLEMFEIRNVTNIEPDHYQQIIAEHIAVSELSDEHINNKEITEETASQVLTTALTGTLWSVGDVLFGTVEERNEVQAEITALGLNGNVDLTNRPIVLPETMQDAGYTDFDGDYATLYSMTYTAQTADNQDCTLLMTPIKQNGTVLGQNDIDDYVDALCAASSNINALKGNDTQGLLMHVLSGTQIDEMDEIAEQAHDLSDQWEGLTEGELSSIDISRGSVWQAVNAIGKNWNCYITPRVTVNSAGSITGRYLDIAPAQGTFRGVRLSVDKNMSDSSVVYDDSEVLTALYGYGGSVDKAQATGDDKTEELTFADVVWTETQDHPAKPADQTYLEDPAKTALYGRNGRARFGYYQNGDIKDAEVLLQKTWEALQRTSSPKISISGTVTDLYRLGYADQPLRLHDTAIVEIRETGEVFSKEIIRLEVDLIDPTASQVEIGDYIPNIIYINRDTDEKARGGGGGGGNRGKIELEDDIDRFASDWIKMDNQIGMVVGIKNGSAYIKAASIVASINDDGGTNVKISADTIDIDGLIQHLETEELTVESIDAQGGQSVFSDIFTTQITVDETVDCYEVSATEINGEAVQWLTATDWSFTFSTAHNFVYRQNGQDYTTSGYIVGTKSSSTINYLGHT